MLDLYLHHGRLDPNTGGTDEEGNVLDDWGFDGPRLTGVIGTHRTYDNMMNVFFVNEEAMATAKALTGWEEWDDNALRLRRVDGCTAIHNAARNRDEFFGDWGLIVTSPRPEASPAHA